MTVINLWLTLLKGSACQRVRLIGNKSPIQSEFEGNMRACAYSPMLNTFWLSVFVNTVTQCVVDPSNYHQGSLFLQAKDRMSPSEAYKYILVGFIFN